MGNNRKKMSVPRRRFLRSALSLGSLASLSSSLFLQGCEEGEFKHLKWRIKGDIAPSHAPLPPTRIYPTMPEATVAVAGIKRSIKDAVREAIEAAGGLSEIEPGQTVMIKPNICGPKSPYKVPGRITTNPEVTRAVIRILKEKGAKVLVGDRSAWRTEYSFFISGHSSVCKEEGAIPFPLTKSEYVNFLPGKRHWSKGFRIPKILQEVDHIINLPALKNHEVTAAEFTCCLKAFVGICNPADRHMQGEDDLHTENISEKIAELNLCLKPTINIVDASAIVVEGGPDGLKKKSKWAESNLILASKDRVACDAVALAVLKRYAAEKNVNLPYVTKSVWDQVQIYYAAELGLGQANAEMISIEDVNVALIDEIKANWV